MLASRRQLVVNGVEVARTPLLVPSFSSKGFPKIGKIFQYMSEFIDGEALVSSYDIYHKKIKGPFDYPSLVFLDSGGYEAAKDTDLSDTQENEHIPKTWCREWHEEVLKSWDQKVPTVVVSYDHPDDRKPIVDQIEQAKEMAMPGGKVLREILIKPETKTQIIIQIDNVIDNVHALADFDVIGVTEKEMGTDLFSRMTNIARLRKALRAAGLRIPIHVFGSLDTISTPFYFVAGADIFDGLTWLRYAYLDGLTLYRQNFGVLALGFQTKTKMIDAQCWTKNYYYIKDLELEMRRFLNEGDFASFKHHGYLFKTAYQNVIEAIGE